MPSPDNTAKGTTRYLDTKKGILPYTEIASEIAPILLGLYGDILQGKYCERPLTEDTIKELHRRLCGNIYDWAGEWRDTDVTVGDHTPPPFYSVPTLMRQYVGDLEARLSNHEEGLEAETLAFSEWKFAQIHPFKDFNGRLSRLITALVADQLKIPPFVLPPAEVGKAALFSALREADKGDLSHLTTLWENDMSNVRRNQLAAAKEMLKPGRSR